MSVLLPLKKVTYIRQHNNQALYNVGHWQKKIFFSVNNNIFIIFIKM